MQKKFYFISILLLFSIIFFSGCNNNDKNNQSDLLQTIKDRDSVKIGISFETKPLSFLNEKNEPDGFEVEIAKKIAKNILGTDTKIEYIETNGYNAISLVASGKVDFLISSTTITPQRKITTLFSEPYYIAGQAILVRQDSKIKGIKDLNRKKVIIHMNTTAESTIKKYAPGAIMVGFKSFKDCIQAFAEKQGEAFISDDALLIGTVLKNSDYKILPQRYTIESYGIAMKNSDESKTLLITINNILNQMKKDGSLDKLKEKWKL
ncbi:transporter substrate-binding domain-containing protein [bacterium]|nr:transporter substrate-binding domain-containing protein [bacterium]